MKIPYEKRMIEEAIIETVRKNRMMECYVRPLVWYGYGEIGAYVRNLPVNVMVAAWEWETYLGKEALEVAFGQRLAHG